MLTTDASDDGWAAHFVIGNQQWHTFGFYYHSDHLTSSNQRETAAVLRGLSYFKRTLQFFQIHGLTIRSDNSVTVYNLQRQGAGIALLHLTRAIFSLLENLDIRLHVSHIPGVESNLTDALSRVDRVWDYALRPDIFDHAVRTLKILPTMDLFASNENKKCQAFVALPGPGALGAVAEDAFALPNWNVGVPYLFPPVQLISNVLQRVHREGVTALIVLPKWQSQPWWGLFRPIARSILEIGNSKEILIPGRMMRSSQSEKKCPPGLFLMAFLCPQTSTITEGE
jgi:hypothetical protein